MNFQLERLPDCKATLQVEIPKETVATERAIVLGTFASQAKVPGFRKGKIPSQIIEQRFADQIKAELEERLINSAIRQAAKDEDLDLLSIGGITNQTFPEDGTFSCMVKLTTNPKVDLPDYSKIPVRLPRMEIGEEQVGQSLERLRERYATFSDVEERNLQMGDFAVLSYEGSIDGKPVDEAVENPPASLVKAATQWVKMDEEGFLPGFCNGLVDAAAGETREVTVVLDEDFSVESLRNTEILYQVEITAVKEQELPELNDAFAEKLDAGKTLDEIKEVIHEQLAQEWEGQIHSQKVNQIVAYLDEQCDFELPPEMIAEETQSRVNEIAADAQKRGMPESEILALQDEIVENASRQAKLNVKTAFILDNIAEQEKIDASNDEVSNAIMNMAAQQGKAPKKTH